MKVESGPKTITFFCGKTPVIFYDKWHEPAAEFAKRIISRRQVCVDVSPLLGEVVCGITDSVDEIYDLLSKIATALTVFIDGGSVRVDGDEVRAVFDIGDKHISLSVRIDVVGRALVDSRIRYLDKSKKWRSFSQFRHAVPVCNRLGLFARVMVDGDYLFGWSVNVDAGTLFEEILEAIQVAATH